MSRIKIAFVAAFFALTILPAVQWATGFFDIPALQEKRRLAPLPDFFATPLHGDGRLSAAINKWFDDRYGFRSLLIRLKNQIDYWAFRHSDKIFIGREGWLYLRQSFDDEIVAERAGDAAAERVHLQYLKLVQYLAGANIRLIVIGNPVKESTYPQYLPGDIPTLPRNSRYQRLRAWLHSRREFDYIDGDEVLAQCHEARTFNLIDMHMTFPGGVCFARALIAQISKDEARSRSPWDHAFKYIERPSIYGGQADFLALLFPVSQMAIDTDRTYGGDNDRSFSTDPTDVFEWSYHAPSGASTDLLPPVVLFGDSFLDAYRTAGIQSYLSAAYRARDNGGNVVTVLRNLPAGTRYFVFEFLEPWTNVIGQYKFPESGASATH